MPNPNIVEDTRGKHTGPKTALGKFRSNLNKIKSGSVLVNNKNSKTRKTFEKFGVKFSTAQKAIEDMQVFKDLYDSLGANKITELESMYDLINILKTDLATRAIDKVASGIPLDEDDIKQMKLLKETLESTHKMKYGTKHINLNLNKDIKDIRQQMFDE